MKNLIVYYSYSGNTKQIAELIKTKINADIVEIKTKQEYKGTYNQVVEQGKKEVNEGFEPEINQLNIDLSAYDNIILGTPVWWYTFAPAVKTFLSSYNLSGKTIYPFATNGGWIGHTFEDIEKALKSSSVKEGLDIYFAGGNLKTPLNKIENWIEKIK